MTVITNSNYVNGTAYGSQTKPQKGAHRHAIKGKFKYIGDNFVCTNKKEVKKWLECAKASGTYNGITYYPEKSYVFGLFKSKAKYSYITKPGDTPKMVREMFNLKDGALREYDDYIFDADEPYEAGKTIYFAEESIKSHSSLTIF